MIFTTVAESLRKAEDALDVDDFEDAAGQLQRAVNAIDTALAEGNQDAEQRYLLRDLRRYAARAEYLAVKEQAKDALATIGEAFLSLDQ